MIGKYKIITLCGSTKFKDKFMEVQKELTLNGNIVLIPEIFTHSDYEVKIMPKEVINALNNIHKIKIDISDEIYIINVNGYIGENTKSEIEYATSQGKNIMYLEDANKEIPEVSSLRWLANMFSYIENPKSEIDKMSNSINIYCTAAANKIEDLYKTIDSLQRRLDNDRS